MLELFIGSAQVVSSVQLLLLTNGFCLLLAEFSCDSMFYTVRLSFVLSVKMTNWQFNSSHTQTSDLLSGVNNPYETGCILRFAFLQTPDCPDQKGQSSVLSHFLSQIHSSYVLLLSHFGRQKRINYFLFPSHKQPGKVLHTFMLRCTEQPNVFPSVASLQLVQ